LKNLFISFILFFITAIGGFSQTSLYDDSRISSVFIEISPDSLEVIMTDVLSDHYFMATFVFDDGAGRDTLLNAGFRLRGNTSRLSEKKSFKVSFNEYVTGRKYQGVKKINLNGQHNDPTMVREKLFYDTWKNAGLAERRTSFVRLYINQVYYGLYTNLEEFDKEWLERVFGADSGNLYKCTYPADLDYLGANPQTYKNIQSSAVTGGRAYDLQTNEVEDDYSDLVELITLLDQPADSVFEVQIAQIVNVDGLLKAFALDVATGNWDDYMYNKNNYYLYHHPVTGKFEFISYVTDTTVGVDWVDRDWATRNCLDWYKHGEPRPLAEKILSVPAFMEKYQRYLDTIARLIIHPDVIFPHIDSMKVLVTDAAIDDIYRTLDYGYTIGDFVNGFTETLDDHTPYGIKPFLTTRFTTILQQLPSTAVPDDEMIMICLSVYPIPANDLITMTTSPSGKDRQGYILDMPGRTQRSFTWGKNRTDLTLSVAGLTPGVYLLVVEDSAGILTRRFIKN
jgi:spore coat protein H